MKRKRKIKKKTNKNIRTQEKTVFKLVLVSQISFSLLNFIMSFMILNINSGSILWMKEHTNTDLVFYSIIFILSGVFYVLFKPSNLLTKFIQIVSTAPFLLKQRSSATPAVSQ